MQVDIYINQEKFDTDAKTLIAETKQVNDFFNIGKRQTSYTNTFKLPKTERNIALLGGMSMIGNTSIKPYKVHQISVYRSGIQTISEGVGYFKATNDYFNIFIYDDNINLFDTIGDKTLADLNLTYLNHTLNIENWLKSFERNDYTYAIADYGKLDNKEFEINYQVPSLFVKFLWDKIFSESGFKFKYTGRSNQDDFNPFMSEQWRNIAITIDEGFPKQKESLNPEKKLELYKNHISLFKRIVRNIWGIKILVQELPQEIIEYIRFNSILNDSGILFNAGSSSDNRSIIKIKEDGFYKININGSFYNLNTENASLFIEKDGINLFTINDDFKENQSKIGFEQKIYLKVGDELLLKIKTSPNGNESHYSYDLSLELWLDNSITAVNFSSYLSKIKQKDFIKDVMNFFGLMSRKNKNTYEFISFEELLNPLSRYQNSDAVSKDDIYQDWSSKFHKVTEQDSKVGGYAKKNILKYKYDDAEDTFADGSIRVDDATISDEMILFERIYKAPENSNTSINGLILKKCNFYEKEIEDDGSLKSVKPKKTSPYFFIVLRKTTNIEYKLSGAINSNNHYGSIPFMSFENLDFNSIISNKYAAFGNMINYGQKLKMQLYLSVLDIHNLDFFKLKYFKQLGSLYYLSKPIKFIENGINTIEIIKIKTIESQGEFNNDFNEDYNI